MSANTLTVVSAVAGIVVGFMTSWWFTRSSKLQADADRVVLLKEISTLRSLLNGVAESVIKPISTSVGVDQALRSAQLPDKVADTVARSIRPAASVSGTDVFVRATLGSLLDEHGEVSVSGFCETSLMLYRTQVFPRSFPHWRNCGKPGEYRGRVMTLGRLGLSKFIPSEGHPSKVTDEAS